MRLGEKARFVEICDEDGKLAAVVFIRDNGILSLVCQGDKDFAKYCKTYGAKEARLITKEE